MTDIQSMMLTGCFCAIVGYVAGSLYAIMESAIDAHKERKRLRKENEGRR